MDKLTVGDLDKIVMAYGLHENNDKATIAKIAAQLANTMRENERLRMALIWAQENLCDGRDKGVTEAIDEALSNKHPDFGQMQSWPEQQAVKDAFNPTQNRDSIDFNNPHYCKQCHSIIGCDCRPKTPEGS